MALIFPKLLEVLICFSENKLIANNLHSNSFIKRLSPIHGSADGGQNDVAIIWRRTCCMVFFQAMLLLGYAYAHLSIKWLGIQRQSIAHIVLMVIPLTLLSLFIDLDFSPPETIGPSFWLLKYLVLTVGLPYFAIASLSPLLQRWFSLTDHKFSQDPYFLYASSNIGSFLALISYPFIFERFFRTAEQSKIWGFGYGFLFLMVIACASIFWRGKQTNINLNEKKIKLDKQENYFSSSGRQRFLWIFIAFIPSSLMLGLTGFITTNLAAIPLLWILPLALYLLTFVMAFAKKRLIPHTLLIKVMPFFIIPLAPTFFFSVDIKISLKLLIS